jgi:transcriptional regulator with XRE-family HTH domain
MNIGRRIQELRESRGMSKSELARRGGTTRNTLYRIEAGKTKPSSAMVAQIARGLDLDPGELFPKAEGVPNSLDELLERRGARTRHLASGHHLLVKLRQASLEEAKRIAEEVDAELEAIRPDLLPLLREFRDDEKAVRLMGEVKLQLWTTWRSVADKRDLIYGPAETEVEASAEVEEVVQKLKDRELVLGAAPS